MKPRRWIVIFGILFVAFALAVLQGISELEKSRGLENALKEYLSPLVGGEFRVERVRVGFFSVYLSNVQVNIPLRALTVAVRDIKVGLSFRRFIASRGDLSKCIDKIILLGPRIEVAFSPPGSVSVDAEPYTGSTPGVPRNVPLSHTLPVQDLLIKDGVFEIGFVGDLHTLADRISGRLWETNDGIDFEMKGRLGARGRNLSISGVLSDRGKRHRLSLRLDRARIARPIRWQAMAVSGGTLDGVCEVLFTDRLIVSELESSGWVKVSDGEAGLVDGEPVLRNFGVALTFSDTRVHVDSCSTDWGDLGLAATGVWDISGREESRLDLACTEVDLSALVPNMPVVLKENILGNGRLTLVLRKKARTSRMQIDLGATGFSLWGDAVSRATARGELDGKSLTVDSATIAGSRLALKGGGFVDFGKSPLVYSLSVRGESDAALFLPESRGDLRLDGSLRGMGRSGRVEGLLASHDLTVNGIPLGGLRIALRGDQRRLTLGTVGDGAGGLVTLSGTVDSVFARPTFDLRAAVAGELLLGQVGDLHPGLRDILATAAVQVVARGTADSIAATGRVALHGRLLSGVLRLAVDHTPGVEGASWALTDSALVLNGTPCPVVSRGSLRGGVLRIDTLAALAGVSGSGRVRIEEPRTIDLDVDCRNVPLRMVDGWALSGQDILRSGVLTGAVRVRGKLLHPSTRMSLRIRNCDAAGVGPLQTDVVASGVGSRFTVQPFVVRRDKSIILSVDTVVLGDTIKYSGNFANLDLGRVLAGALPDDTKVRGSLTGWFVAEGAGLPVHVEAHADRIELDRWGWDSVVAVFELSVEGVRVTSVEAREGARGAFRGDGFVPWSFLGEDQSETDTLAARLRVKGDLLALVQHNLESPIGGVGPGDLDIAFTVASGEWRFSKARIAVPEGRLTLHPFVPDTIEGFVLRGHMDDSSRAHLYLHGTIRGNPVTIATSHVIPEGYEAVRIGPIDCGVFWLGTTKKGIHIHLPGFQEPGAGVDVEFGGMGPFKKFSLSGPAERMKITGTWNIRNGEFTFPFLEEELLPWPDPYPYVTWELNVGAGNRKVVYFYDIAFKRRFLRFVECTVEPGTKVLVRGRILDNTFRIFGGLRSYKGEVFYGRVFDRNFEVGVDFEPIPQPNNRGYDNMPIIWGSAEAFSDTSRFDRIKLSLMVRDSATGALADKGRFRDVEFRLSSNFEEMPGESEREFYRAAGLKFATLQGAGEFVSDFGEQYLHRYLLQRFERRLAKRLGLDVISFETSIASNYFYYLYNRRLDNLGSQWDNLAFANVGVTIGRYFARDKLFLKWRTELVPTDTLLHPEHSVSFEYQPFRFLWLEAGTNFYRGTSAIEYNPSLRMQLRVPLKSSK